MDDTGEEEVFSSHVGPVITVAEPSKAKPVVSGILWLLIGGNMVCGSAWMGPWTLIQIMQGKSDEWALVGIAAGIFVVGWFFLAIFVRRLRAALWPGKMSFAAGPGGISIEFPESARWSSLLTNYNYASHGIAWEDIRTWYPYVLSVNGIPRESEIVFEGAEGWELRVPTLFFQGSRDAIAGGITYATGRDDLLESYPDAWLSDGSEEDDGEGEPDESDDDDDGTDDAPGDE